MAETREFPEKKEQCFVIMPISDQGDYPKGHFDKVYQQIFKPAIESAGYEAYRVDENKICDSIMKKIFDAIYNCPMAICDLSNKNPNVLYELGLRQAYDKPVVLLQDDKTDKIFDISGINTVYYKSDRLYENILDARERLKEAIISTKNGQENTVIKIWQAVAADVSHITMTKEDKLEIMLRGIVNDMQELKMKVAKNELNEFKNRDVDVVRNFYDEILNIEVELKQGITKKEINLVLDEINYLTENNFKWHTENGKMYVKLKTRYLENMDNCLKVLSRLGELGVLG